jgi:hypothetical protein
MPKVMFAWRELPPLTKTWCSTNSNTATAAAMDPNVFGDVLKLFCVGPMCGGEWQMAKIEVGRSTKPFNTSGKCQCRNGSI